MNDGTNTTTKEADPRLAGIRGWLVLPAIGLVLGPILGVVSLVIGFALYSDVADAGWGVLYAVEMVVELVLVVFTVYAATRFFQMKRDAPFIIILLLISALVVYGGMLLIELGVGADDFAQETGKILVRCFVSAAIWIPYFKISKRVKATFVN
jgi:hypothetical protein